MIASLPLFHAISGQMVLVVGSGEAAQAKRRLIERAGAIATEDIEAALGSGARLAFVALEDREEAQALADRLRRAGMLINVPDRPDLCDFTVPSILDRDPVLVAIGTGGASAGLAKHLRLRLENILPQRLGGLAAALLAGRGALRRRIPDAGLRRSALDEALREGGALDPLREHGEGAVSTWLALGAVPPSARQEEIQLASNDPDDLTLRQARMLGEADALVLVGEIPEAILARARADAVRMNASEARGKSSGLTVTIHAAREDRAGLAER